MLQLEMIAGGHEAEFLNRRTCECEFADDCNVFTKRYFLKGSTIAKRIGRNNRCVNLDGAKIRTTRECRFTNLNLGCPEGYAHQRLVVCKCFDTQGLRRLRQVNVVELTVTEGFVADCVDRIQLHFFQTAVFKCGFVDKLNVFKVNLL